MRRSRIWRRRRLGLAVLIGPRRAKGREPQDDFDFVGGCAHIEVAASSLERLPIHLGVFWRFQRPLIIPMKGGNNDDQRIDKHDHA
jgi:hypothetical protein